MKGEGGKKARRLAHGGGAILRFLSSLVRRPSSDLRRRLYEILEHGPVGDGKGNIVARLTVTLIAINLVAVVAESVPSIEERYRSLFHVVEWVSLVILTIDYGLRLWLADQHIPYRHLRPGAARWRYARSVDGIIDLVAVLPFWLAAMVPADLRVVLVFRVIRFLKLGRYSPGMRSLLDVLYAERRALTGCFVILLGASLIAATVMHLVERHVQPEKFGTIPDAMWWAIVTLGTIGYGDVVPVTPLGRVIASLTIFIGLIMIALPVGIIATAFAEQIHRRDFIITWTMVARVPLFAELNAVDIADIMRLLRAQTVEPGAVIVRRGEAAHSMYFIAAGEVEIDLPSGRVRLGVGHFFGEIAVLRRARRSATVIALTHTSLLVLDAHDLHALMQRDPRVAERIRGVVRGRLGHELITPHGDLVTEEIEDSGDTVPPVRPV
jgi:voltage-gated potassium channel